LRSRRQHHVAAIHLPDQLDLTVEQHVEGFGRTPLPVHTRASGVSFDSAVLDQPVQLLVGQALEEEGAA
jgi:hypothetical protein